MNKNSHERKKYNSQSEIKMKDNNIKYRKEIKTLISNSSNNKPHTINYYLIKYFFDNQFRSFTLNELSKHILNIYKSNPKLLVTNFNEVFKDAKYVKSSFKKIVNNKIFVYNSNESTYKLNEYEALLYLKSQSNDLTSEEKERIMSYKTPNKLTYKKKKLLSLEEPKEIKNNSHMNKMKYNFNNIKREKGEKIDEDDENIKIKKEVVNIKEEGKTVLNEEKINIKHEEVNIKEEEKIKEENIDDEELNFDKILDLFNGKLYDNFYLSFSEQGLFEQLQEKIEKFLDKYNQNIFDNNMKFKLSGVINQIRKIQDLINDLNKNKEIYDNLIVQFEQNKKNMNFYIKLLSFKYNEIKYAKELCANLDFDTQDIDKDAKELYTFDKKKHDLVYEEIINTSKKIKDIIAKSDGNKKAVKKELIDIVNYSNNNNIKIEEISNLYEIADIFKNESNSFIKREYVAEKIFHNYNKHLKEFDEKIQKLIS